ncbi:MAG: hypothetical protein AMXMBFR61_01880 [Fimbriimonadales bacterium]
MLALVTGFGPFGSVTNNPSAELARRLAAHPPDGWEVDCELLAVEYRAVREAVHLLTRRSYDAAFLLGVHNRDTRMYLELFGRREVSATPDMAGETVGPDWFPPGPERIGSKLFGLPSVQGLGDSRVTWSYSAGGYLCNAWYYLALATPGAPPCGFVHVPHSEESKPHGAHMPLEEQESLLRAIVTSVGPRLTVDERKTA